MQSTRRKINLLFDIDHTLAIGHSAKTLADLLQFFPYLNFFAREDLIIDAFCPHVLFPGALELIKWVFNLPDVNVSFFSAGDEKRNKLFVSKLLFRAFGEASRQLQHDVKIYSKPDLVPEKESIIGKIIGSAFRLFSGAPRNMKKDLENIFSVDLLDNAVLIDDNPAIIAAMQERNVLLTPSVDEIHFYCFHHPHHYTFPPEQMEECILSINHLFFVAGLLSMALNAKDPSLADALFSLQYKLDPEGGYIQDKSIHKDIRYYLEGLRVLQTVNPALSFYGGELAEEYFSQTKHMAPSMS